MVRDMNVLYFGYGANRSPEMIHAIIGRNPKGFPATLDDYELCVQVWDEIPLAVQKILEKPWDSNFRTYCIRAAKGSVVTGKGWYLTRFEFEKLVGEWEMHGLWYKPVKVQVRDRDRRIFNAETEIINDPTIKLVANGCQYRTFLNDKSKMFYVATEVREEYLRENLSRE